MAATYPFQRTLRSLSGDELGIRVALWALSITALVGLSIWAAYARIPVLKVSTLVILRRLFDAKRLTSAAYAAAYARELGVAFDVIPDFVAALDTSTVSAGTVLVTGSFHTVGDAMALLQVSPLG